MAAYNLNEIDDKKQSAKLVPVGRHPARLKVDIYQRDKNGILVMGKNDLPQKLVTTRNFEKWNLLWQILGDGESAGLKVFDFLAFSPEAIPRVKAMFIAAGICTGTETSFTFEPGALNDSLWWIVIHHEISKNAMGVVEAKEPFDARGCPCAVCVGANGKKVYVRARVDLGSDAVQKMDAADVEKYDKVPF